MSVPMDEFIMGTCLENVPGSVVEKAKMCVLDTIGVALAGRKLQAGKSVCHGRMAWGRAGKRG